MLTIITLAGAGVFQSGDGALCGPDIARWVGRTAVFAIRTPRLLQLKVGVCLRYRGCIGGDSGVKWDVALSTRTCRPSSEKRADLIRSLFSEKATVTAVDLKGKLRANALGDHRIHHPRVQECNTRSMLT